MRNLNSDVKASFCQQVDDCVLLKITEKIIQRNVFEQTKKKPGLEELCHEIQPNEVITKCLFN